MGILVDFNPFRASKNIFLRICADKLEKLGIFDIDLIRNLYLFSDSAEFWGYNLKSEVISNIVTKSLLFSMNIPFTCTEKNTYFSGEHLK